MVKVAVGSQYRCTKALRRCKYRLVIVAEIAYVVKSHGFVSAFLYQVCGRPGEVLVQKKLHSATLMLS